LGLTIERGAAQIGVGKNGAREILASNERNHDQLSPQRLGAVEGNGLVDFDVSGPIGTCLPYAGALQPEPARPLPALPGSAAPASPVTGGTGRGGPGETEARCGPPRSTEYAPMTAAPRRLVPPTVVSL